MRLFTIVNDSWRRCANDNTGAISSFDNVWRLCKLQSVQTGFIEDGFVRWLRFRTVMYTYDALASRWQQRLRFPTVMYTYDALAKTKKAIYVVEWQQR